MFLGLLLLLLVLGIESGAIETDAGVLVDLRVVVVRYGLEGALPVGIPHLKPKAG